MIVFPVFPGSEALEKKDNIDELARGIGFPLVVKPSGGGGGKEREAGARIKRDRV